MYLLTAMAACEITVLKGKIVSLSIVMWKDIISGGKNGEQEFKYKYFKFVDLNNYITSRKVI